MSEHQDARPPLETVSTASDPETTLLYFVGAGPGSVQRVDVVDLFARRLSALGLRIDWYYQSDQPGGPAQRQDFQGQAARVCGRSRLPGVLGRAMSKLNWMLSSLHFFGRALRGQHQIVQVRDDFLAGALGLLAARLRGRRFVFWLSYPFPEARLADAREGRARSPAYAWLAGQLGALSLYRIILPRADHAFVQSEQMRLDVLRPGVDPRRVSAVPMGIPDEDIPDVVPPCSEVSEPIVLYLGTLASVRRLEMIVQAFARVLVKRPDARLMIVGDGDLPEDRLKLEQEVTRLGVRDSVQFTGQLPRSEALAWVRRAAVCLSPFYPTFVLRSTSPTKLVEYMALGKAVVANDHPDQAAVIAASGAGLCTPWDEGQFAIAILTLLDDPIRREVSGKRARTWVMANRRYSQLAIELQHRYALVLAGTPSDGTKS